MGCSTLYIVDSAVVNVHTLDAVATVLSAYDQNAYVQTNSGSDSLH